jgi:hypothetical protein
MPVWIFREKMYQCDIKEQKVVPIWYTDIYRPILSTGLHTILLSPCFRLSICYFLEDHMRCVVPEVISVYCCFISRQPYAV